jgi:hypothetical protein
MHMLSTGKFFAAKGPTITTPQTCRYVSSLDMGHRLSTVSAYAHRHLLSVGTWLIIAKVYIILSL